MCSVGAWVIAAGVQQRISSRSAVVFVHGRDEPEAASSAPGAAVGRQLRALKFYFLKEDFDRNVVASQAPVRSCSRYSCRMHCGGELPKHVLPLYLDQKIRRRFAAIFRGHAVATARACGCRGRA